MAHLKGKTLKIPTAAKACGMVSGNFLKFLPIILVQNSIHRSFKNMLQAETLKIVFC